MDKANDSVDEFREWERTHNRENYGRYDAFASGRALGLRERDDEIKRLKIRMTLMSDELNETVDECVRLREENGVLSDNNGVMADCLKLLKTHNPVGCNCRFDTGGCMDGNGLIDIALKGALGKGDGK